MKLEELIQQPSKQSWIEICKLLNKIHDQSLLQKQIDSIEPVVSTWPDEFLVAPYHWCMELRVSEVEFENPGTYQVYFSFDYNLNKMKATPHQAWKLVKTLDLSQLSELELHYLYLIYEFIKEDREQAIYNHSSCTFENCVDSSSLKIDSLSLKKILSWPYLTSLTHLVFKDLNTSNKAREIISDSKIDYSLQKIIYP